MLKNWTLPVAMATGTVVYMLFHSVPFLQPVGRWYLPVNRVLIPLFTFLVLFVTFCKVDFRRLRLLRWHLWECLLQLSFVAVMLAFIFGLHLTGRALIMAEAVFVCVIAPCAAAAAVVTAKLGGRLEELTSYTLVSNFISALLIPITFPMLPQSESIALPTSPVRFFLQILWQVSMVLLLPMLFAYIVKHHFHCFHRWVTGVKDLSYYLWGVSLAIVTGTTVMNVADAWHHASALFLGGVAVMSLLVCVVQFATGRYIGHFFDRTIECGQSFGQKNTSFAIWVATAFLNPLSSVGPGCYILWQNIINSVEIWFYRKKGLEKSC